MALVLGTLALTGCATRGSVRQLDSRLDRLGADIAELRRQQERATAETSGLVPDARTTGDRLRELDRRLRDLGDRIEALGKRLAVVETTLRETAAAPGARPHATAVPPGSAHAAAEQAFAAALATFRAGEHGQAVLDLLEFIGKYPQHPLAGSAQLWIGEAYFTQHDYRQALVEYRKAVDAAAGAPVAADAWLKIGHAHAMLRDRASATSAWQRVVREYPGTEAATRARALLRK
jgi:tol-pal system protein YbgF